MFITRKKFENEMKEAEYRGYMKAEKELWERKRYEDLQGQIGKIDERLRKLEPAQEFLHADNVRSACAPVPY